MKNLKSFLIAMIAGGAACLAFVRCDSHRALYARDGGGGSYVEPESGGGGAGGGGGELGGSGGAP